MAQTLSLLPSSMKNSSPTAMKSSSSSMVVVLSDTGPSLTTTSTLYCLGRGMVAEKVLPQSWHFSVAVNAFLPMRPFSTSCSVSSSQFGQSKNIVSGTSLSIFFTSVWS